MISFKTNSISRLRTNKIGTSLDGDTYADTFFQYRIVGISGVIEGGRMIGKNDSTVPTPA